MTPREIAKLDRELTAYLQSMTNDMGRPERRQAMSLYITGLLLDGERKSVEPIAARLVDDVSAASAMRQRLQECVANSAWSDDEMRRRLALKMEAELPGVEALVVDDTGFPKKGARSVGVHRQYSGTLGRTENCQVATSLHLAGEKSSVCIALRLYVPEVWAGDEKRRRMVGVPAEVQFLRKWEIALQQIDDALAWGVRKHIALADAGYGDASEFRDGLTARGLRYMVGVSSIHTVWPPGADPRLPERVPGQPGRPPKRAHDDKHKPISIGELATTGKYRTVSWREGSRGRMSSRFAFFRVRSAERRTKGKPPSEEQWLICEWPEREDKPTKFWLSTLSDETPHRELVRVAKLRWRVERDYQDLKGEVGLDHFEGRTWRGFHHHATLCMVAHAFLALRRALFPPKPRQVDAADGSAAAPVHPAL